MSDLIPDDINQYESHSPAAEWAEQGTKRALDELFNATFAFRNSKEFLELMQFVKQFRFYSLYNALLIHAQRPGAQFVAPAYRWQRKYGRRVKPNANPIVILQPMGPVMFVFDVADTEAGKDARPLPAEVEKPWEVRSGIIGDELEQTIENAKRDGIRVHGQKTGSQAAGSICSVRDTGLTPLLFPLGRDKHGNENYQQVPVHYELLLSEDLNRESNYATLIHELAHLYCGHIGSPNKKWWPDRRGLPQIVVEFEAESVSYLVCARVDIESPSEAYLAGYVNNRDKVPPISLECVMKAAGLLEAMGRERLKPRKKNNE
jgi:hypothetical protein